MKNILFTIAVLILKIIYIPMKFLKTKNKIVYISRQSNSENLDFKLIRKYTESEYPDIQNVVLTKKIEGGLINKITYIREIFRQMYHVATAKIVILDTYCIVACVLKHKKETKIIQIWHALGAIKKFGYQSINKPSGTSGKVAKIMKMHKNYDFILSPSKKTAEYYKEAFRADEKKIKYIGMPRLDYILKIDELKKEKIYDTYPNLREKENILYVPTFRKGKKVELDELIEKFDTDKYNLIVKLHPLDLREYEYKQKQGVIYENKFKTYDLIKIADKLITDYSSLAMESALLNIPVYFYTYDIEYYKKDPGLNFNFEIEEIGKYQTTDVEKLLEMIEKEYDYDVLNRFNLTYMEINTEDCTKQLVEFIVRLINNYEFDKEKDKKLDEKSSKEKLSI